MIAGDPLIVNDGYLLNNPALRRAIIEPKLSPFCALVEAGFVKILSRNEGAVEHLADVMAGQGITSAEGLVADPEYVGEYQPALAQWSAHLNSGFFDWFRPWPAYRTDAVYRKLASEGLDRLADRDVVNLEVLKLFREELGDRVGSRTAWEETAESLVRDEKLASRTHQQLMAAANEVYQYTWGCVLADKNNPMSVQTRLPQLLSDLDRRVGDHAVEARDPVSLFVPDIRVARKGIDRQWDRLVQSVNTASVANKAKREFLTKLDTYNTGGDVNEKQIKEAAREYSEVLAQAFGHDKRVQVGLDLSFAAAAIGTTVAALTGPVGLAIGVGVTAGGIVASHVTPVHNLFNRLGQTRPTKWIRDVRGADHTATSTFELDLKAATSVLEGIPRFAT